MTITDKRLTQLYACLEYLKPGERGDEAAKKAWGALKKFVYGYHTDLQSTNEGLQAINQGVQSVDGKINQSLQLLSQIQSSLTAIDAEQALSNRNVQVIMRTFPSVLTTFSTALLFFGAFGPIVFPEPAAPKGNEKTHRKMFFKAIVIAGAFLNSAKLYMEYGPTMKCSYWAIIFFGAEALLVAGVVWKNVFERNNIPFTAFHLPFSLIYFTTTFPVISFVKYRPWS